MLKLKLTIFISIIGLFLPFSFANASTVLSSHKYAWSDNVGYINFEHVIVGDSALSGYAWSSNKGFIIFDPTQGGVSNDSTGNLSGSAWGEQLGWIDFDNVSINPTTGKFSGTATGELVGTITFDCGYCDVETDWRTISTTPTTTSVPATLSGRRTIVSPIVTPIQDIDILKDGIINVLDFNTMMVNWGSPYDIFDFNMLMVYWGTSYQI